MAWKVVIHRPGGDEQLQVEEYPSPEPGAGQVAIAVRAIGVNYADVSVRTGGCLTQLLRIADCEVTGVVGRSHKVEAARAHGAHHVIDKSKQPLWTEAERVAPEGFDLILDANGVETLAQSYAHLRRPGKLVVYGFHTMMPRKRGRPRLLSLVLSYFRTARFSPFDMVQQSRSVLAFNLSYLFDRAELFEEARRDMERWLSDGRLKPPPVTFYPLDDVAKAHAEIESGETTGKLVLLP